MKKIKIYIAISLNGRIAKSDGSVDWLEQIPNPEKTDYGYKEFYQSVDTTIQGFSTYQQILNWGIDFPYSSTKNYVLTRQKGLENTEDVEIISENHIAFIQSLKAQEGKDIWCIGGGQINTLLLNHQLVDELILFVMPIVLSGGIELFEALPNETALNLMDSKAYSSGVMELKYAVSY